MSYNPLFRCYDKVVLIEDCIINNRKRAAKGDIGQILCTSGTYGDKTSVKFYHLKSVIHYIPTRILEPKN